MRRQFNLQSASDYTYLSSCTDPGGMDDAEKFGALMAAFRAMQFSEADIHNIIKIVGVILDIGNLQLIESKDGKSVEVGNPSLLELIAKRLVMQTNILQDALLYRILPLPTFRGVALNKTGAIAARDAIAKELYDKLFHWIVTHINKTLFSSKSRPLSPEMKKTIRQLSPSAAASGSDFLQSSSPIEPSSPTAERDGSTIIGVLDIFGFECFAENSLEQLFINFANERLQGLYSDKMVESIREEHTSDGIYLDSFADAHIIDNKGCIQLLNGTFGVFTMLDEQSRLKEGVPTGSDKLFHQKAYKRFHLSKHTSYSVNERKPEEFIIRHYAGDVNYSIKGFVAKNSDPPFETQILVLGTCRDEFVHSLIRGDKPRDSDSSSSGGGGGPGPGSDPSPPLQYREPSQTRPRSQSSPAPVPLTLRGGRGGLTFGAVKVDSSPHRDMKLTGINEGRETPVESPILSTAVYITPAKTISTVPLPEPVGRLVSLDSRESSSSSDTLFSGEGSGPETKGSEKRRDKLDVRSMRELSISALDSVGSSQSEDDWDTQRKNSKPSTTSMTSDEPRRNISIQDVDDWDLNRKNSKPSTSGGTRHGPEDVSLSRPVPEESVSEESGDDWDVGQSKPRTKKFSLSSAIGAAQSKTEEGKICDEIEDKKHGPKEQDEKLSLPASERMSERQRAASTPPVPQPGAIKWDRTKLLGGPDGRWSTLPESTAPVEGTHVEEKVLVPTINFRHVSISDSSGPSTDSGNTSRVSPRPSDISPDHSRSDSISVSQQLSATTPKIPVLMKAPSSSTSSSDPREPQRDSFSVGGGSRDSKVRDSKVRDSKERDRRDQGSVSRSRTSASRSHSMTAGEDLFDDSQRTTTKGRLQNRKTRATVGGLFQDYTRYVNFNNQLSSLISMLSNVRPYFIRCINPNKSKKPNNFDSHFVYPQIIASGIPQAMSIRRCGFPFRMTHKQFTRRYYCCLPLDMQQKILAEKNGQKACTALVEALSGVRLDSSSIRIGTAKVFWRHTTNEYLESLRVNAITKPVIAIQGLIRRFLVRRRKERVAQLKVQSKQALTTRDPKLYKKLFMEAERLGADLPEVRTLRKAFLQIRREADLVFSLRHVMKENTLEAIRAILQRALTLQYVSLDDDSELSKLLQNPATALGRGVGTKPGIPASYEKLLQSIDTQKISPSQRTRPYSPTTHSPHGSAQARTRQLSPSSKLSPKLSPTSRLSPKVGERSPSSFPSPEAAMAEIHGLAGEGGLGEGFYGAGPMAFTTFNFDQDHERLLEVNPDLTALLGEAIKKLKELHALNPSRKILKLPGVQTPQPQKSPTSASASASASASDEAKKDVSKDLIPDSLDTHIIVPKLKDTPEIVLRPLSPIKDEDAEEPPPKIATTTVKQSQKEVVQEASVEDASPPSGDSLFRRTSLSSHSSHSQSRDSKQIETDDDLELDIKHKSKKYYVDDSDYPQSRRTPRRGPKSLGGSPISRQSRLSLTDPIGRAPSPPPGLDVSSSGSSFESRSLSDVPMEFSHRRTQSSDFSRLGPLTKSSGSTTHTQPRRGVMVKKPRGDLSSPSNGEELSPTSSFSPISTTSSRSTDSLRGIGSRSDDIPPQFTSSFQFEGAGLTSSRPYTYGLNLSSASSYYISSHDRRRSDIAGYR